MKLEKNTKYIFWIIGILLAWALFKDSKTTMDSFSIFGNSVANTTLIGIPIILLLLIPIYGIYISIRKGYNPFKMWGSYIIPVIWIIVFLQFSLSHIHINNPEQSPFNCSQLVQSNACDFFEWINPSQNFGMLATIVIISFGFLIGWGIHSLFRRTL